MEKNKTSAQRREIQLLLLLLLSSQVFSQNRTVSGKVTDAKDGQPLQSVSIRVKGTGTGTQTSADGSFSVLVPKSAKTLEVSSVGFEPDIWNTKNGPLQRSRWKSCLN